MTIDPSVCVLLAAQESGAAAGSWGALVADDLVPLTALTVGLVIATTAIVAGTARRLSQTRQFEQSRREVAAYVAEGSISPDDASRLLAAGPKEEGCGRGRTRPPGV